MSRYRILWNLDTGEDAKPCGVVIERRDYVEVIAPADLAFPPRITEPYLRQLRVMDEPPTYVYPNHPEYFDLVCFDLGRSFALTGEFEAPTGSTPADS